MSAFTDIAEAAVLNAFDSFLSNDQLGQDEKALVNAVVSAYKAGSVMALPAIIEDVIKVVTDLKAKIDAAQPAQQ